MPLNETAPSGVLSAPPPPLDADLAALLAEVQEIAATATETHIKMDVRRIAAQLHGVQAQRNSAAQSAEYLAFIKEQLGSVCPPPAPGPVPPPPDPAPAPVPPPPEPPAPAPAPVPSPPPAGVEPELLRRIVVALAPTTFGAEKLRERVTEVLEVVAHFSAPAAPPGPPPAPTPVPAPVPPPSSVLGGSGAA